MEAFSTDYFDDGLRRVGTRTEKWDEMRAQAGADLLPLWVADMDFPSPPAVQEAILRRAAHPTYGYTQVLDDDYQAVAGFWGRRHGLALTRPEIRMLPCVVTGLKVAVQALTQPGDGVIVQPPVYGPFYKAVTLGGRRVMENPLVRDDAGRYAMDLEQLETLLRQGAKLMLLCSPHNPVSRLWSRQELTDLLALLGRYGVPLVSDEIHGDFVYAPQAFVPLLTLAQENVLSLAAASKTFNLAGLQQSYLFVKDPALAARVDAFLAASGVTCGNLFALEGTRAAFQAGDAWLDGLLRYLDAGRAQVTREIAQALPQAVVSPIEATYLAWLDLSAYGYTNQQLMEYTHRAGVALTDGAFFGEKAGAGCLRLNFGCPHRYVTEGIRRLQAALA